MNTQLDRFQPLLDPKSIAFVGASNSPGKWGNIVLRNIIKGGYQGNLYPVNPREKEILGRTTYAGIQDIPESPDLAVLIIPPQAMLSAVEECVKKGVRAGLVITAGFAEIGDEGMRLQTDLVKKAKQGGMILVGPNCNGIMRPSRNLFPEMPSIFPAPGSLGIVSQSGNVAMSLGRRSLMSGFGLSSVISSGNEADLQCDDFISFLGEDPETKVIISYLEGLKNAKRFMEVVKQVTPKKPVVIIKAGETSAGARAAVSHTAALVGSDAVFDGACRQAGIIRVHALDDLFNVGIGFLNQPVARGNRAAILTTGGGFGVLAADVGTKYGLDVVSLSNSTLAALAQNLPSWWNPGNPVDLVAGNSAGAMLKNLEILLKAPETDCILMMGVSGMLRIKPLSANAGAEETEVHFQETVTQLTNALTKIQELSHHYQKPVVTATEMPFTAAHLVESVFYAVGKNGFAVFRSPETAAIVMSCLAAYGLRQKVQ